MHMSYCPLNQEITFQNPAKGLLTFADEAVRNTVKEQAVEPDCLGKSPSH